MGEMQRFQWRMENEDIPRSCAFYLTEVTTARRTYQSLGSGGVCLVGRGTQGVHQVSGDRIPLPRLNYEGGLILVSHDFRLINQVAEEIWVCENKTVTKWNEDIQAYKDHLKKNVMKAYRKEKKRLAELTT